MSIFLTPVISAWGGALLDFLWQGVLIGLGAAVLLRLSKQARPQVRYGIACVALLLCFALPIASVWYALPHESAAQEFLAMTSGAASQNLQVDANLSGIVLAKSFSSQIPWVVIAWALGCVFFSLRMAGGLWWISNARRHSKANHHFSLQFSLEKVSARFGFLRQIELRLCNDIDSPVTAGWWKPVIFMPGALLIKMPPDYIEALLAHELAHIKRHDYLVNLLQSTIEAVLFFHPVVWWLSKQIRIERENIADDLAAGILGEPRKLAVALAALDEFQLSGPLLAPAAQGGNLMSRIQRLIKPTQHTLNWKMSTVLIGMTLACITVYAHDKTSDTHKSGLSAVTAIAAAEAKSAGDALQAAEADEKTAAADAKTAEADALTAAADSETAVADSETSAADSAAQAEVDAGDSGKPRVNNIPRHETYALVTAGKESMLISGNSDDIAAIKRATKTIAGDFLWFRSSGKTYIVQEPAVLAQIKAAWEDSEKLSVRMDALSAQMDVHSKVMDGISTRMDAVSHAGSGRNEEMEKTGRQMEALGRQQEIIGREMQSIGEKSMDAKTDAQRLAIDKQMQAQQEKMSVLDEKMASLSAVMEQQSAQLQNEMKPMEALGREMQSASKPMEALGQQMSVLGEQQQKLTQQADEKVLEIIGNVLKNGQALAAGNLAPK